MTQDKIDRVIQYLGSPREGRHLEFKAAQNQYSHDKALAYCAALANEGGGNLVLGVTDAPPRVVCGTQAFRDPQELERKLHDKLRIRIEVDELEIQGRRVVLIHVGSRPSGQPIAVDGRYLMRQGESLVDMTPDHLKAIFAEGEDPLISRALIKNIPSNEIEGLIDTKIFFTLSETEAPDSQEERCRILAANKVLLRDAEGTYGITGLGAALFAHDLENFDALSGRRLRFVQYASTDRTAARRDFIARRGYALEFDSFLTLVSASVPQDERIRAAHRVSAPMYSPVALRELVANSIVHQDFNAHPSLIAVELYEDRLEVTNPGIPLMDTRRFVEDTRPRNFELAMMMRELRMCEARGSGIQRVLEANEQSGAADPKFHIGDGVTKTILIGKHDFTTMSASERIWAIFMHACRMYASRSTMTNQSFRDRYGLAAGKSSMVSLHFQQAVDDGLIRPQNEESTSKRYARYVPFYATT